jgi:hypothetical protein
LGPLDKSERKSVIAASSLAGKYETLLDRRSAFEMLQARAAAAAADAEAAEDKAETLTPVLREFNAGRRYTGARVARSSARSTRGGATFGEAMTKMVVKELTGTTGRRIVRGILGGLFKGR